MNQFDEYYEKGYLEKVVTTNLNYRPPELLEREWYAEADMTEYLATIIDHMNHDASISGIQSPTAKINQLLQQLNRLHSRKRLRQQNPKQKRSKCLSPI